MLSGLATAATLGRSIPFAGGASDLELDERRGRVYLPSPVQNQVQVFNIARQSIETVIPTDTTPVSVAMSRDGQRLYVTCYDASVLNIIDLNSLLVVDRIGLPGRPESVAVANDEIVVITTTGSGAGGAANSLLLYNPLPDASPVLTAVTVAPPAPGAVVFPPPNGRPFLSKRSQLVASRSGAFIAGVNQPAVAGPVAPPATVFVYEAASRTVLRSRAVAGASTAAAISDDGSRVLAGAVLLEAQTLQILGTQGPANVPYPIDPRTVFTLAANQGGAVFSADGQTLYSGLNIAPTVVPPLLTGSQMMLADPDNLTVRMGIQLPDTLAGRMVLSADGTNLYALSDAGIAIIPVGNIPRSPLAVPAATAVLLTRDPCGVNTLSGVLTINNPGTGRVTPSAQLFQIPGLANQPAPATAPSARATGMQLTFSVNAALARGNGTFTPAHEFVINAPEAINIPERVRVTQNARDSDARGNIVPIPIGLAGLPLPDLLYDVPRQRIYIANASFGRVEIYDIRQQLLLNPVKVGQTPISMALTADGATLYVATAGAEGISIVDPERLQTIGRVAFPPVAFNSNLPAVLPSVMAWSQAGLLVQTTNGTLWKVVGDSAVLRPPSRLIGTTPQGAALPIAPSTMASTPGGEYVLVTATSGTAYLYDAVIDDFVAQRTLFTAMTTGFIGPVAAGPQGRYFVANGILLNQALQNASTRPPGALVSAVAQIGPTSFANFSPAPAGAANTLPAAPPTIQILDANTGNPIRTMNALEGPLTSIAATARAATTGRTMAVDTAATTAYAITASGLSVIPLTPVNPADRPGVNPRGAVNLGSYQTAVAPNGLISIFGISLGESEVATSAPLPIRLGGTCVTLNNIALPLFMVSPGQINAQIPPDMALGTFPLVIRSLGKQAASLPQQVTVSRYAPAVLVDPVTGQLALFHADGVPVSSRNPAQRDKPITMYAVGLGATTGGRVAAGNVSPSEPLAETADLKVFFGDPGYRQSEVIVDWSGLTPGFIGLYQLNLRVPGFHEKGDRLPVTIRIGAVDSPTTGPVVPYVAVE